MTDSPVGVRELLEDWHAHEPVWFELVTDPPEEFAQRVANDLRMLLEIKPEPRGGIELSEQDLGPALTLCELCLLNFTDLALICYERQDEPEQLLWPNSPQKKGTFHLQVFAINLANSLGGVRTLILHGHDTQAKVLVRYFVELADALLACAAAENFFDTYRHAEPDPDLAFRYWQKHLKPSRVRDILAQVDAALGAPPALHATMQDLRSGTYRWLSNWSHIHPLGLILSGLTRVTDEKGRLVPKFGGVRDTSCRTTLSKASMYAWYTTVVLLRLLSDRTHGWHGLITKRDHQRAEFAFRSELIKRYYLRFYSQIHVADEDADRGSDSQVT